MWKSLEFKYEHNHSGKINCGWELLPNYHHPGMIIGESYCMSEEFTLRQILKHLRIEEETRIREKNLNIASSSKVHYVSQKNLKAKIKERQIITLILLTRIKRVRRIFLKLFVIIVA